MEYSPPGLDPLHVARVVLHVDLVVGRPLRCEDLQVESYGVAGPLVETLYTV